MPTSNARMAVQSTTQFAVQKHMASASRPRYKYTKEGATHVAEFNGLRARGHSKQHAASRLDAKRKIAETKFGATSSTSPAKRKKVTKSARKKVARKP